MAAITERHLVRFAVQADGSIRVAEDHHDDGGRVYRVKYVNPAGTPLTQRQAEDVMNARDVAARARAEEEYRARDFIMEGGDPNDFQSNWLTATSFRRRLVRRFARGTIHDREFMCVIAPWIAQFTTNQIANALSITTARANKIRNRAIRLRDVICPALEADEADEDIGV